MDRLTKRLPDGKAVMDCDSCGLKTSRKCTLYKCRNQLMKRVAAYEDTKLTPEDLNAPFTWQTVLNQASQKALGMEPRRLRELAEADKDGRVRIIPESQNETCGHCYNFERESGTRHGLCAKRPHPRNRYGKMDRSKKFIVYQTTQSCKLYTPRFL